jgi:hypothetical protein
MPRLLWQQRQDIGPAARVGAAMVYMTSRERSLLCGGGDDQTVFRDTWEWDGEGWVQVEDTGPTPNALVGLAFDAVRNRVVFYSNPSAVASETWEWDGEAWTQVEDTGPQAPNGFFSIVYDRARQATVLEGGSVENGSSGFPPVGTWVWDGTVWTQVADVGPPQRLFAALGYDASRERVVHFGGSRPRIGGFERDTWEWDGNAWERVANMGPTARDGYAMTGTGGGPTPAQRAETLLFGGRGPFLNGVEQIFRDTWTWDGQYWRQRQDMGPSVRAFSAMTWDVARSRAVLFGGKTREGVYLGDTWESFEAE